MQPHRRQHLVLTMFVVAAAVFLTFWGCPYLRLYGHGKLCIALYAILFLIFFYGRVDVSRRRLKTK